LVGVDFASVLISDNALFVDDEKITLLGLHVVVLEHLPIPIPKL
jgi:hypothetical protein